MKVKWVFCKITALAFFSLSLISTCKIPSPRQCLNESQAKHSFAKNLFCFLLVCILPKCPRNPLWGSRAADLSETEGAEWGSTSQAPAQGANKKKNKIQAQKKKSCLHGKAAENTWNPGISWAGRDPRGSPSLTLKWVAHSFPYFQSTLGRYLWYPVHTWELSWLKQKKIQGMCSVCTEIGTLKSISLWEVCFRSLK